MASVSMAAASGLLTPLTSVSKDVSSRRSFSTTQASVFVKQVSARTVCSAENKESFTASAGKLAAALALAAAVSTSVVDVASADVAGLTPCKDSSAFAKREKQQVKKLESRLKKYEADSAPALAINATIEKTHRRFANYGKAGLLCGPDGLPHLIVDGDQKHLGEFVFPGIVFLYITGWIGWVGRDYIIRIKSDNKPTQKEIIIDVPLAINCMSKGFTWPLSAVSSFRKGTLVEDDSKISVSPR
jgi:photosystem I subunit 3